MLRQESGSEHHFPPAWKVEAGRNKKSDQSIGFPGDGHRNDVIMSEGPGCSSWQNSQSQLPVPATVLAGDGIPAPKGSGWGGAACLETIGIVYRHYWEGVLDSISISFVFDQIH